MYQGRLKCARALLVAHSSLVGGMLFGGFSVEGLKEFIATGDLRREDANDSRRVGVDEYQDYNPEVWQQVVKQLNLGPIKK